MHVDYCKLQSCVVPQALHSPFCTALLHVAISKFYSQGAHGAISYTKKEGMYMHSSLLGM